MFKYVVLAVVCGLVLVHANDTKLNDDEKEGSKSAFARGLERFGNSMDRTQEKTEQLNGKPQEGIRRIFSPATAKLTALGGGKPMIREQYREHHYTPLAPSVMPAEHKITGGGKPMPTAAEAAKLYVPHAPLQFTTDQLH